MFILSNTSMSQVITLDNVIPFGNNNCNNINVQGKAVLLQETNKASNILFTTFKFAYYKFKL